MIRFNFLGLMYLKNPPHGNNHHKENFEVAFPLTLFHIHQNSGGKMPVDINYYLSNTYGTLAQSCHP